MDQTIIPATQSATERKLMLAFMQMHRAEWHQRTIAGCSPSEIRVLFCLRHAINPAGDNMKVSQISKRLRVTSPAITQMLKALEARGLVERQSDTDDKRMVNFRLTPQGQTVTLHAIGKISESMRGLMEFLGDEQSAQLAELLTKAFYYFSERAALENDARWNGDEEA